MIKRFGGQSGKLMTGVAIAGAAAQVLQAVAGSKRGQEIVAVMAKSGQGMAQTLADHLQARFQASEEQPQAVPPAPAGLGCAEALARLGLAEGATDDDIRSAHRRLILQVHPDTGGNTWLAQQLNEARDLLLAGRS